MDESEIDQWVTALLESSTNRTQTLQDAYVHLRDAGLLANAEVHRYMCRRGCQLVKVFRWGGTTLAYVADYRFSPGMNAAKSVPEARAKNTLDGDRWWPAHVYDVTEVAKWAAEGGGVTVACRHFHGLLRGDEILADIAPALQGRKINPTRLPRA